MRIEDVTRPGPATAESSPPTVLAEIAWTLRQRQRGLMFRRGLADDRGMLFVYPSCAVRRMWMKNTLIPLDMIFIGSDLTVVGVVADAEPGSLDLRGVRAPSMFVLEVNAGWAQRHGIAAGTAVRFAEVRSWPVNGGQDPAPGR